MFNFWRLTIRKLIILLVCILTLLLIPTLTTFGSINKGVVIQNRLINTNCPREAEIKILAAMMFGEGEELKVEYRIELGRFLINEAIKNKRSLCAEFNYKQPKGSYKYSSSRVIRTRINNNKKGYEDNVKLARDELLHFDRNPRIVENNYNSFITVKLAKTYPPKWFKDHLVRYKISGLHVFGFVDGTKKFKGYHKLIATLEKSNAN